MKKTKKKSAQKKGLILSGKQIELLSIVWFCVILFLIIHMSFIYGTGGIRKGMTYGEAMETKNDQFGFDYYGFFQNSEGNYVVVHYVPEDKVGSRVTEVVCIDARTVKHTQESFSKVQVGMDPIEVARLVGIPFNLAESEYEDGETPEHTYTLYATTDGKVYMLEWEFMETGKDTRDWSKLLLKSIQLSDAEALEEDIPSDSNIGLWISSAVDVLLFIGAVVFTLILLFKKKKTV